MRFVIGMTGPTGAGKSSVSEVAREMGFRVIDCDRFARVAVEKGSRGLLAVVNVFGNEILNTDGTLNRKALAKCAFSSKENTERLNKTLLPFVVELINREIENEDLVLLDAPTLFESGADSVCDVTFAVLCDKEIRKKRIIERDALSEAEADLRINAGKSDEFYMAKTPNIIYNDCEISCFKERVRNLLNNLMGGREDV